MSTGFAPVDLLRGTAVILRDGDPHVGHGAHWHADLSPALGLPVHPFLIWRSHRIRELESLTRVVDRTGKVVTLPASLSAGDVWTIDITDASAPFAMPCWAQVIAPGATLRVEAVDAVAAPNGGRRVLAARSKEPYHLAAADLRLLRITGEGDIQRVEVASVDRIDVEQHPEGAPWAVGLPDDELPGLPSYVPCNDLPGGDWYDRVKAAWPPGGSSLPPPDDAPEQGIRMSLAEEVDRIRAAVAAGPHDWLGSALGAVSSGLAASLSSPGADPRQKAELRPLDALLTGATADPGIARWFGLTGLLRPYDDEPAVEPNVAVLWIAAVSFLVDLDRAALAGLPGARPEDTLGLRLRDVLVGDWVDGELKAHLDSGLDSPRALAAQLSVKTGRQWAVRTMLVPCPAVEQVPPDRPAAVHPTAVQPGRWQLPVLDNDGVLHPLQGWQQTISLVDDVPEGPVAFARFSPDQPHSLHRLVPGIDGLPERAARMLAGWPTSAPWRPGRSRAGPGWRGRSLPNSVQSRDPVLVDDDVPPAPSGATWRVWPGDWLGRWGRSANVGPVPEPQRPDPPPPYLQAWLVDTEVAGVALASAGVIRCAVALPEVGAPGARPIDDVRLTVNGQVHPPLGPAPIADHTDVDAPPTLPGNGVVVEISAVAIDSDRKESAAATAQVVVFDRRPVPPPTTAPRILMAGRRDITGTAELQLRWPAVPGAAGYRVHLGSEDLLRARLGLPAGGRTRAARAKELVELGAGLGARQLFELVTMAPVPPADPTVQVNLMLPGGLRGLGLVRIVPVTAGKGVGDTASEGVEAPFDSCGVTPVAVPYDESPGAPGLTAEVTADGRVRLSVSVTGLDPDLLAMLDVGPPQARLLRHLPGVDDPAYWPELAVLDLADNGTGIWHGATTVGPVVGYPPWTQLSFSAQGRYPAERTVADADLLAPSDVGPVWDQPFSVASPWGPRSATTYAMVQAELETPTLTMRQVGDGTLTLDIDGVQPAPAGAVAAVRATVYGGFAGGLVPVREVELTSARSQVEQLDPTNGYGVILTDPLGRSGPVVVVPPL